MKRRGGADIAVLLSLSFGGFAVAAFQTPLPPEEIWKMLVGLFGLPGAVAWGLFGWAAWKHSKREAPTGWDEAKFLAHLHQLQRQMEEDGDRREQRLTDDVRGALMVANAELKSLIRETVREELKRG